MFKSSISELMAESEKLRATLLFKLIRKRKWGESHIPLDKVKRLAPGHLRGEAGEIILKLKKENLILSKPTHYGEEISLNPKEAETIYQIVKRHFEIPKIFNTKTKEE